MKTALLLLEIQYDYFSEGRIPLEKSSDVARIVSEGVLKKFREEKLPIFHAQQISTHPDATYLLPCTKGAEFYASVAPLKNEQIIKKHYPNAFKDTPLLNLLHKQQVTHLIICGMMTHLAVDATVRAAYDFGFTCTVLSDACATRQLEFNHTVIPTQSVHYAFLAGLATLYANVMSSNEYLSRIMAHDTAIS